MDRAVGAIGDPQLLFIRCQSDAMARAAVALDRALLVTLDLDAVKLLAGRDVPYFESEQAVDIHEHQGVASIHRERTDHILEWSDLAGEWKQHPGVRECQRPARIRSRGHR